MPGSGDIHVVFGEIDVAGQERAALHFRVFQGVLHPVHLETGDISVVRSERIPLICSVSNVNAALLGSVQTGSTIAKDGLWAGSGVNGSDGPAATQCQGGRKRC